MPRRATPLNPTDGPQARFALALRRLRDEAGFDAKTIDAIAAENHIPRSTLYAALRGTRIPTIPVLAALVRAWGGDQQAWVARRTAVEDEIERNRLARSKAPDPDDDHDALNDMLIKRAEREVQRQLEAERQNASPSAVEADELISRLESEDLLRFLLEGDGILAIGVWKRLLYRAGMPSHRQVAHEARLPQAVVSRVLRGADRRPGRVRPTYAALRRLENRIARQAAFDAAE
ncbi:hypothetical protein ABZ499_27590 [Streptomyces sp. NPDC019990]|uniref:hypothetical protein n=1 Tax=Streptomyces sp. NPDC019990 TaxID=3154693 RepID=UPI00340D41BF